MSAGCLMTGRWCAPAVALHTAVEAGRLRMKPLLHVSAIIISIAMIDCGPGETFSDPGSTAPPTDSLACGSAEQLQAGASSTCSVFVSSSSGNDGNPGTFERPVRTLTTALALAPNGPAVPREIRTDFRQVGEHGPSVR